MNRQEIFEKAVNGIFAQGQLAIKPGSCMYYDYDTGCKCAIGHLVSDEDAKTLEDNWAGSGINSIYNTPVIEKYFKYISNDDIYFLSRLQDAHDEAYSELNIESARMESFKKNVIAFAIKFELSLQNITGISDDEIDKPIPE